MVTIVYLVVSQIFGVSIRHVPRWYIVILCDFLFDKEIDVKIQESEEKIVEHFKLRIQ